MNNIYIVGFEGMSKSEIAKKLQRFLPFQMLDLNEAVERVEVMTIADILQNKGQEEYRNCESQLLSIVSKEKNQIITCDAGILTREENVSIMKSTGTIIGTESVADICIKTESKNEEEIASEIVKELALAGRLN